METYTISFWSFIITEKDCVLYIFRTEAKEKVEDLKNRRFEDINYNLL